MEIRMVIDSKPSKGDIRRTVNGKEFIPTPAMQRAVHQCGGLSKGKGHIKTKCKAGECEFDVEEVV